MVSRCPASFMATVSITGLTVRLALKECLGFFRILIVNYDAHRKTHRLSAMLELYPQYLSPSERITLHNPEKHCRTLKNLNHKQPRWLSGTNWNYFHKHSSSHRTDRQTDRQVRAHRVASFREHRRCCWGCSANRMRFWKNTVGFTVMEKSYSPSQSTESSNQQTHNKKVQQTCRICFNGGETKTHRWNTLGRGRSQDTGETHKGNERRKNNWTPSK